MTARQKAYAVIRHDYDHWEEKEAKETSEVVEICLTQRAANTAARRHLLEESKCAPDGAELVTESLNETGGYVGRCTTREDDRDNFAVEVEEFPLDDAPEVNKPASQTPMASRFGNVNIPGGKIGGLRAAKFMFLGRLPKVSPAAAQASVEVYGGLVVDMPGNADYVVEKQVVERLQRLGVDILGEKQFIGILWTGIPPSKELKRIEDDEGDETEDSGPTESEDEDNIDDREATELTADGDASHMPKRQKV